MPADAPRIKLETTRAAGAEVVTYDRVKESREEIGAKLSSDRGLALIKPFDDPFVIAGQGTAGLEISEALTPDIALIPGSGGGLASGVALALPKTRVFAIEPEGHDDITRSLQSGKRERNAPGIRSICDGLLTEEMGDITYELARTRFAGAVSIPDIEVQRAMAFAFRHLKLVLEPSGAIGLAAALTGAVDIKGKSVVIVASGGNVDAETFMAALKA
jgi:threonine dehydratase